MRSRRKADRALVLHLLGCAGESLGPELDKRLDAAIERCEAVARPKSAWRLFDGEHADKSGCENCSLSMYCELRKRGVSCIQ